MFKKFTLTLIFGMAVTGCGQAANPNGGAVVSAPAPPTPTAPSSSMTNGGQDSGGGNLAKIEKLLADSRAVENVEALMLFALDPKGWGESRSNLILLDPPTISNPEMKKAYLELRKHLVTDIAKSPIALRNSCVTLDNQMKVRRSAVSLMNRPGTPICLDPWEVVIEEGYQVSTPQFLALMLHEFAHHFGMADKDHAFATAMADALSRSFEDTAASVNLEMSNILVRHLRQLRSVRNPKRTSGCVSAEKKRAAQTLRRCVVTHTVCTAAQLKPLFLEDKTPARTFCQIEDALQVTSYPP